MPGTGIRGTGRALFITYTSTRVILSSKRVSRSGALWGGGGRGQREDGCA